jgi:molybdate transport system regulatory protein
MAKRRRPSSPLQRPAAPKLRARLWIDVAGKPAMTDATADLLEQIEACGSLSEAARRLHFSYRRAWMLLDAANRRWSGPLAITATGGKRGGGTRLTPMGIALIHSFRDVQIQLEHLLDHAGAMFNAAAQQAAE